MWSIFFSGDTATDPQTLTQKFALTVTLMLMHFYADTAKQISRYVDLVPYAPHQHIAEFLQCR